MLNSGHPISVIIPTYKEPEYLDLCLKSLFYTQTNDDNQVIVVVDGFMDINKPVLDKYPKVNVLHFEDNQGLSIATNYGVYSAIHDRILIVNDDNVFPSLWDVELNHDYKVGTVISPNQIEPNPSMFKQFHIADYGQDSKSFDLDRFLDYELNTVRKDLISEDGCTLPIFMNKYDYIRVGGWDIAYPSGHVVDWDFFLKCELSKMKMIRTHKCNFYHFASKTLTSNESVVKSKLLEQQGHEYFRYKWGQYARHNSNTNSKMIDVPYL